MKQFKLSMTILIFVFTTTTTSVLNAKDTEEELTVTVHVKNLKNTTGFLEITLFDSESNFLEKGVQKIVRIEDKSLVTIQFEDVEAGTYAVSVIHDEDENGDLNTGFLGIPTEDYGFSNNAKGRFGPPSFEETKFDVTESKSIEININ